MTDRPPSPARRAALLRLLDDWEAGRMTSFEELGIEHLGPEDYDLWMDGLFAHGWQGWCCLTPAGLSAARAIREKGE